MSDTELVNVYTRSKRNDLQLFGYITKKTVEKYESQFAWEESTLRKKCNDSGTVISLEEKQGRWPEDLHVGMGTARDLFPILKVLDSGTKPEALEGLREAEIPKPICSTTYI